MADATDGNALKMGSTTGDPGAKEMALLLLRRLFVPFDSTDDADDEVVDEVMVVVTAVVTLVEVSKLRRGSKIRLVQAL